MPSDVCHQESLEFEDENEVHAKDSVTRDPQDVLCRHMILKIICILIYLFDLASDTNVALHHFLYSKSIYFYLTLGFIVFPALVVNVISLRWYLQDYVSFHDVPDPAKKVSKRQWILRIIFFVVFLGPLLRLFDSLMFMIKVMRCSDPRIKKIINKERIYQEVDNAMLTLFETFGETAPQLILQIYILQANRNADHHQIYTIVSQVISIFLSFISLSYAFVRYNSILRQAQENKDKFSICGQIFFFIWRFFTLTPRILTLALFAYAYHEYLFIVIAAHWGLMFMFIRHLKSDFCDSMIEQIFFDMILAVIYIFCYLNPVAGNTKSRMAIFYILMTIENAILVIVSYPRLRQNYSLNVNFFNLLIVSWILFILNGYIFEGIYYLCFHPTLKRIIK